MQQPDQLQPSPTCAQLAHIGARHQLRPSCQVLAERYRRWPHIQPNQVGLVGGHVAAQLLGVGLLLLLLLLLRRRLLLLASTACRRFRRQRPAVPIQQVGEQLLDIQLQGLRHAGDFGGQAPTVHLQVEAISKGEAVRAQWLFCCRHDCRRLPDMLQWHSRAQGDPWGPSGDVLSRRGWAP